MEKKKMLFEILGVIFLVIGFWFNNIPVLNAAILPIPDVCSDNILQKQNEVTCKQVSVGAPRCFVHAECCVTCETDTAVCVISEPLRSEATIGAYDTTEFNNGTGYVSSCTDYLTDYWAYCSRTASGSCPTGYSAASYEGYNCGIYKEKDVDNIFAAMGRWNASQQECITCNGKKNAKTCATTGAFWLDSSGNCNGTGYSGTFQKACDATVDTKCDDHPENYVCDPGKQCDSNGQCVAVAACNTNPTVTITPVSQTGLAGTQLTYTIDVRNNDDAACPTASRTFNLTSTEPGGGWAKVFGATSFTLAKGGGTSNTTYKLTSPAGAAEANYTFKVKATDSVDNAKTSEAPGTYTVSTCVGGATFIKFDKDAYKKGSTLKISFAVTPATDYARCVYTPSGSNVWESLVTGPTMGSSISTVTGDTLGTWTASLKPGLSCPASPAGCIYSTNVVECLVGADCASLVCDYATHTCIASVPTPTPTPPPGNVSVSSCVNCDPAASGGNCTDMKGNELWTSLSAPRNTAECLVDAKIQTMCAQEGAFVGTCNIVLSSGTICPCTVSGPVCDGDKIMNNGETGPDCGGGGCPPCGPAPSVCSGVNFYRSPLNYCTIQELLEASTGWILGLVSSIIILILIIGGIMYVASTGDQERIRTAKNIIYYAVLGLAIILLSYSMIAEIKIILKIP